jgi:DNA-binding NarL/FixJ family response regulator
MNVVTKDNTSGIVFAGKIRKEFPDIKIVIMTAYPEITFINEAIKAGAHSFFDKDMGKEHFFYILRSTMKGINTFPVRSDHSYYSGIFTEQEIAIIRLVGQGKTRNEMAMSLNISEAVLGRHITSILDKSGFDNIMKFAVYFTGQGLIIPAKD